MKDERTIKYEKYCKRMVFEHQLINNRLTWLLVSQALLFASYATSHKNSLTSLRQALPVLGFVLSLLALLSIVAALGAKLQLWRDVRGVGGYKNEPFWVNTLATWTAAAAELLVPVSFAFAWYWLWSQ